MVFWVRQSGFSFFFLLLSLLPSPLVGSMLFHKSNDQKLCGNDFQAVLRELGTLITTVYIIVIMYV